MPGVVIIGGGISGLSTAYYLARGGAASTILESRPRLGGVIQTERVDGCTIEAGPDSFLSAKPAALELIRELGLADQVICSNDHLRLTYVRKGGRMVPLPDGLMMMVPTKILPLAASSLFSFGAKVRMGLELLRTPKMNARLKAGDESVADFVRRHYGQEAVDYLAEPLLSGIYGGDPRELSVTAVLPRFVELAAKYGSLTRGVLTERAKEAERVMASRPDAPPAPLFRTLMGGLGQMVDALAASVRGFAAVRRGRAETIERTRSGAGFRIRVDGDWMHAGHVVLACEAHSGGALLGAIDPRSAQLLDAVPYSSSLTVALGWNAYDFARLPEGFGFLVPKKERRRLVACTWVGTKFPYRVPAGKVLARCFLGGVHDAAVLDESDEAIVAAVTEELREIAGVKAPPRFSRVFRWPRSMAQYTVGHPGRVAELEARLALMPGLHVAGNAYRGIGIPDCIRMGREAAGKILEG